MTAYSQLQQREFELAENLGYSRGETSELRRHRLLRRGRYHDRTDKRPPARCPVPPKNEQFEMDTEDYNDGEATERTPMPHLYTLLESTAATQHCCERLRPASDGTA